MQYSGPALPRPERRARAPHPGVTIARDYLDAIGLDAHAFAAIIGMDGDRLAKMLAGEIPVDVDAAVRFGRSLGLSPERVMRAQLRHDFARSRDNEHEMPFPPSNTLEHRPFPDNALHGYLARVNGADHRENLYFVHGEVGEPLGADLSRVHRINDGDRMRVFAADGSCVWAGPLLTNLDGHPLFVFAPLHVWEAWFNDGLRAEWSPAASSFRHFEVPAEFKA